MNLNQGIKVYMKLYPLAAALIMILIAPVSASYRSYVNNNYYGAVTGPFAQRAPGYGFGTSHTVNYPGTRVYTNFSNNFNGNFSSRKINYNPALINGYNIRVGNTNLGVFMNNGRPGAFSSINLF